MAEDTPTGDTHTTEVHHHGSNGGGNTWLIVLAIVVVAIIAFFVFRGTTNAPTDDSLFPEEVNVNIDNGGASGTFEEGTPEAETGGANE